MRTLLLCLLFVTQAASAQVYTYIDAEGNRVFTDKPRSSNAERVMLAPSNSAQMSQPQPTVRMASPPAVSKPTVHYQLLRILVPEPDASIHNGSGDMIVTLNSEPGLLPGHSYRLLLNGEPQGETSRSPVFSCSMSTAARTNWWQKSSTPLASSSNAHRHNPFTCTA